MLGRKICVGVSVDERDFVVTGLHCAAADIPVFAVQIGNAVFILDCEIDSLALRAARNIRVDVQSNVVDLKCRIAARRNKRDAAVDGGESVQRHRKSVVAIHVRRTVRFDAERK